MTAFFQFTDGREALLAVAQAICKSRTCEGISCCQWPAQRSRTECPVKAGAYDDAARAALGQMVRGEPPVHQPTSPPDAGSRKPVCIEHDGFEGTIIGHYTTREGKRGVVLQQTGTKVVHVYSEKWIKP